MTAVVAAIVASERPANAQHDIRMFMAESGIQRLEQDLPAAMPSHFDVPTLATSFTCMDFEQSNTTLDLTLQNVDIVLPSQDRLIVYLDFRAAAQGRFVANDLYACFGSVTCQDTMTVDKGKAVLDFDVSVVGGVPHIAVRDVQFNVEPSDFNFSLNGCGLTGSTLTSAVSFTEGWILDYVGAKLGTMASDFLAPALESTLTGLSMESNYFHGFVSDLYFVNQGVSLSVDAGIRIPGRAAACVAEYDKGGPARASGAPVPDIQNGNLSDLNMALNFGLLNEALYAAWRKGLMCLPNERLAALGAKFDLGAAGAMLPGFPAGTEFSLDLSFSDYPKVHGLANDAGSLAVDINGLNVFLHGDRPDGTRNTLHAELSLEVVAKVGVDPSNNSIYAQLADAKITHMLLEDERAATGEGYDVARIRQMISQVILPNVLRDMGPVALTAPVFETSDYAIMLRQIGANKAYFSAGVDILKTPQNDIRAPETRIVDSPAVSNARNAIVRVGGSDLEVPEELLQYQVRVNGETRPISFVRDIKIGSVGVTGRYQVEVAAVDLAGNVDPTPSTATVLVDGIVPFVAVTGLRARDADLGPADISWTMNDDTSAPSSLGVRVEIYRLRDASDVLSAELVETQNLAAGTTHTTVNLAQAGGLYRVEVHVSDEAGNDSTSSLLLASATSGGCSTGGTSGSGSAALLLLALGLLWRRRMTATLA